MTTPAGPLLLVLAAAFLTASCAAEPSAEPITPLLPPDALHTIMTGLYGVRQRASRATGPVGAVVIPHHLASPEAIALGIRALAHDPPARIVLLSPDHFGACPTLLCATQRPFHTLLGPVPTDDAAVTSLLRSPLVSEQSTLYAREHGIGAVLPFAAHLLPATPVVPLVLSLQGWRGERENLRALLHEALGADGALAVSSDFSHYLPLAEADAMDARTIDTLLRGDLDAVAALENPAQSDCPACLWLLTSLAQERGWGSGTVLLHTNAARLLGAPDAPETTSHFTILWER